MADEVVHPRDQEMQENDERRDDHLEREFGVTGREFQRGSDVYAEMAGLRLEMMRKGFANDNEDRQRRLAAEDKLAEREAELFNMRQLARDHGQALLSRTQEDDRVALEDRDGLRFRDAAIHSTAVGSLEGETAVVGTEQMENVPDEEHPDASAQK